MYIPACVCCLYSCEFRYILCSPIFCNTSSPSERFLSFVPFIFCIRFTRVYEYSQLDLFSESPACTYIYVYYTVFRAIIKTGRNRYLRKRRYIPIPRVNPPPPNFPSDFPPMRTQSLRKDSYIMHFAPIQTTHSLTNTLLEFAGEHMLQCVSARGMNEESIRSAIYAVHEFCILIPISICIYTE